MLCKLDVYVFGALWNYFYLMTLLSPQPYCSLSWQAFGVHVRVAPPQKREQKAGATVIPKLHRLCL